MATTKKTRGLGKGLDALFGDAEVNLQTNGEKLKTAEIATKEKKEKENVAQNKSSDGIKYININDIKPNSNQPRKIFDEEKLEELANSIAAHGLIQPLVLRVADRGYEIVAGERRWRAARKIGVKEIPCIVRELTDEENMLLAIIENMQREDLNPIEEAEGISQMIDTYGLTQEQVSKSVSKSRPYITNSLRLLKLPNKIKGYVSAGELSMGHARAILGIDDSDKQLSLAEAAIAEGLSVRQIEKMSRANKQKGNSKVKPREKSADEKRVEEDLKNALGTKVSLNRKGKKGKIEIEFYSKEELERLIELLKSLK